MTGRRTGISHLMAVGISLAAMISSAQAAPSVYPTGTTIYDPDKAYNSYVLFPGGDRRTHLIDMSGEEVHRWDYESQPPVALGTKRNGGEKGHVLIQKERNDDPPEGTGPGGGIINAVVAEVDWDGDVVNEWGSQNHPVHQHHDIHRLANGHTLMLTAEECDAGEELSYDFFDNLVQEFNDDGKVVWQWRASAHLDELGLTGDRLEALKDAEDVDFLHMNTARPLGPNRWYDQGDERFAPDNILVNSRNANVAAIIDRDSGDVVWRIGPDFPATKMPGDTGRKLDQTVGLHDIRIIPKGRPGAGNMLLFDNQGAAGYPPAKANILSASRVLEINPQDKKIVWQYTADMTGQPYWALHSGFISSARRLPNGNTLIDEGAHGRLFQVTRDGEIVWEYISPFYGKAMPDDHHVTRETYRAMPIDYDWAPKGTPHDETPVQPDCEQYPVAPGCLEEDDKGGGS